MAVNAGDQRDGAFLRRMVLKRPQHGTLLAMPG